MSGMAEGWGWSHEEQLGLRRVKGAVGRGHPGLSTQQVRGMSSSTPQDGVGGALLVQKRSRVSDGCPGYSQSGG